VSWIKHAAARNLIEVRDRRARPQFNGRMKFEELLRRWNEAEMAVVTYRLCHPPCARPEVDFLCAQLQAVSKEWYAQLLREVARVRRQLPRL
jgi:hypothetical protein